MDHYIRRNVLADGLSTKLGHKKIATPNANFEEAFMQAKEKFVDSVMNLYDKKAYENFINDVIQKTTRAEAEGRSGIIILMNVNFLDAVERFLAPMSGMAGTLTKVNGYDVITTETLVKGGYKVCCEI